MDFQVESIQNPSLGQRLYRPFFGAKGFKIISLVLIALLGISVIFFFLRRGSFRESGVELKVDGAKEISAGELISYKISYKNENKASLNNVKLTFFYPSEAVVIRDNKILDVTSENFDLGELKRGESGEKILTAFIVGDKGNIKTARAILTFKPSTISSTLQKESSLATTITTLPVPITLVVPPAVINGQSISYLIDYRNQSSEDLKDLRFEVRYPDGFKPTKFSPQPASHDQNLNIWGIPLLKQGEGSRITIQGSLSGSERDTKSVRVALQKRIVTATGDFYITFEKTEAFSVISTPPLSLSLILNGSADYIAHLNDLLRYEISFRNDSDVDIGSLSLSVHLEGNMFDFTTVRSNGFFDSRQGTIFWNGSTVPELNNLRPHQTGVVKFEVRLKDKFSGGIGARESFIKAIARLETPNVPAELDIDKLTADSELITRISTSPTFGQKVFLNDPVFGSSGPFPPQVNEKTVFTVRWSLVNPSSDLTPAKVTAVLAPGVIWENRTRVNGSQLQPVYNDRQKTVTWDLGTLPAGVGVSFPEYEVNFQISIVPSLNQVGEKVLLLKNVNFEGVDTFTKEKILRTIADVTTSDINDSRESGNVQP